MRYVLGVDAGASKTLALVAEETGVIRGFGRAGPGNHQTVGLENAIAAIRSACMEAFLQAGTQAPVEVGVFGLAGADLPEDFALLTRAMESLALAKKVRVENDTMVALRAGTSRSWGVVVVCGAGFNAAGIAPDGRTFRFLGLGWISGDWGGGWDIAREAIRAVARARDGRGSPTLLTSLILEFFGFTSVEALISALYHRRLPEEKILEIVPLVFEAAWQGDTVAQKILIRLGEEVGIAAGTVIRKLALERTDVEVILAGGVFKGKGPLLLDTINQMVHRVAPNARISLPKYAPVVGAVLLALETLKGALDQEILGNLDLSLPRELKDQAQSSSGTDRQGK
jgi:N-acetylglucosamine kinase-like BadF-type ATPase